MTDTIMNTKISLNASQFGTLATIISMISKVCQDVIIREGKISQLSDRRSSIFSIDLTSLVNEESLMLSGIKAKSELLEPFKKQTVDVDLILTPTTSIFQDTYSKIEFQHPLEKYLASPFISEDDLQNKLALDNDGHIFSYTMLKMIIERLSAIQKGLEATKLLVEFKDGEAIFKVKAADKLQSTVGKIMTITDLSENITGVCVLPINPFILGFENIEIDCYKGKPVNGKDRIVLKMTSNVDEIGVTMWLHADIEDEEPVD